MGQLKHRIIDAICEANEEPPADVHPLDPVVRRLDRIARRRSDGRLFETSCPENWTDADAIAAIVLGDSGFYFREVVAVRPAARWWQKLCGIVPKIGAVVRWSLEELLKVDEKFTLEPEGYDDENPQDYPPPSDWVMVR